MLKRLFTEHPATVGETYGEHFAQSSRFGFKLLRAGAACLMHGLAPFLFKSTGSDAIRELHDIMVVNRAHQTRRPEMSSTPQPKAPTTPEAATTL